MSNENIANVKPRLLSVLDVENGEYKTLGDVVRYYKSDASDELIHKWVHRAMESCYWKHMEPNNHRHLIPEIYYVSGEFLNKA